MRIMGDAPATSADAVVKAAERLGPMLRERAPEIEAGRRLPADVLEALSAAGCFRIVHPTSHGGIGADLGTALAMYETLARADGSTAWTVMIGSVAWLDLTGLPRAAFDALFAGEGDTIVAGVFNPTGSIVRDGDGYRVEGRWGFASGCEHATWVHGNCVEGQPNGTVNGQPQLRIAVFAPHEVVIEDTWDVAGLRGTGSHHFHVDGRTVSADRTFPFATATPCIDEPVARLPIPAVIALAVASVALGIGRGALDDVLAGAPLKVPLLASGPVSASPVFHDAIARADTELRAARALLHELATTTWATAVAGGSATLEERGVLRAASTWITERAVAAVDAAHRAGGGGAVYADSPLQRRLRDIQTLRQHFLVRPDTFTTAGDIITGGAPDVPIF
jgi:alkylation response protein AidB-like acyl-CoA dehydrogenase